MTDMVINPLTEEAVPEAAEANMEVEAEVEVSEAEEEAEAVAEVEETPWVN